MYAYHAYNLSIHCEFPLPELYPGDKPADVVVRLGKLDNLDRHSNGGDYFLGSVEGLGMLLVREGCEIVLDPEPGVEESVLRPVILGPLFSILMRQRGFLVLHASSVAINGVAVAFMTHSGGGKSTMADAFHSQGYSLLTDDVMAIDLSREQPMVIPSFPQVKLLPDAASAIGHDINSLPLLHPDSPKFAHQLNNGFLQTPLPLKRIFVLEMGSQLEIVPLSPQDCFVEMVRNSRAVALLDAPEFSGNHLHQCTRLFQQVPICALKRKRDLAALPDVVKLVIDSISPSPCHV